MSNDTEVDTDWLQFAIPKRESSNKFLSTENVYDSCSMYARKSPLTTNKVCDKDTFDSNEILPCTRYVYDNSYFDETLATKFDLVCNDEYKAQLLHVIMMLGTIHTLRHNSFCLSPHFLNRRHHLINPIPITKMILRDDDPKT